MGYFATIWFSIAGFVIGRCIDALVSIREKRKEKEAIDAELQIYDLELTKKFGRVKVKMPS